MKKKLKLILEYVIYDDIDEEWHGDYPIEDTLDDHEHWGEYFFQSDICLPDLEIREVIIEE